MNYNEMKGEDKENQSKSKAYETANAPESKVCPCWQPLDEDLKHWEFRHILELLR